MNLVLIGGKSVDRIKTLIEQNNDSIDIGVYSSVEAFVEVATVRNIVVDRFIIMQDGIETKGMEGRLTSFNNFLGKYYPSAKLITLVKDEELSLKLRGYFISPLAAHLYVAKLKPRVLLDLVDSSIDFIKDNYEVKISNDNSDIISEVIEDEVVDDKPIKEVSKKGRLFGLFGKKDKKVKEKPKKNALKDVKLNGVGQGFVANNDGPAKSSEIELKEVENESNKVDNDFSSIDDVLQDSDFEFGAFDGNTVDEPIEDFNEEEVSDEESVDGVEDNSDFDNFDFSVFGFDDSNNLGIGTDVNTSVDESEKEIKEDTLMDRGYNIEEEESVLDRVKVKDTFELPDDIVSDNSGLEVIGDDIVFEDEIEDDYIEIDDKVDKLKEIKNKALSKELDVDINLDIVNKEEVNIDFEGVNDVAMEFLENVNALQDEYNKSTTKVIERVVNVSDKNSKRHNGVRLVVVTGDRKTGLTKTALNMASVFAKEEKTLYVDFDVKRKGSLCYLGLEDIVEEEEHVQSGLKHLKSVKILPNVVYPYMRGRFDCLISSFGDEVEDLDFGTIETVLTNQRIYQTIVIDCPLENICYLSNILLYSKVVICMEHYLSSVIGTIVELYEIKDEKLSSFLYNSSGFYLAKTDKKGDFTDSIKTTEMMFELDEESINWTSIGLLGSYKDFDKVLKSL